MELVDQLLSRQPGILIVLMSGYTDQKSQWPIIQKKGFTFIQKPFNPPDLLRCLREVMEAQAVKG